MSEIDMNAEYEELNNYCEQLKELLREYITHFDSDEDNLTMKNWLDYDWIPRVRSELR